MKSPAMLLPLVLAIVFMSNACSVAPAYQVKSEESSSDALVLEDFEHTFERLIDRLDMESSREDFATRLLEAQAELSDRYSSTASGSASGADSEAAFETEETGRCLLVSGVELPELESEAGIKRGSSPVVLYTDYLRKSSDCHGFFRQRFGDSWAKSSGSLAISFFSYTI